MGEQQEWYEDQLSKLSNEDSRIPILKEMKDFLGAIPNEELSRMANSVRLPMVFDCLNNSNSEQVDLACDVLSLCMMNMNIGESTNRYGVFLERALVHPFPTVKLMALNEIQRDILNEDILVDMCKKESFLIKIITCISDGDIGVAKTSSDILKLVALSSFGIKQLTNPEILNALNAIMAINELVRFRVYEILVEVAVESEPNFQILQSTDIFTRIFSELENNDLLLKLNVLEILTHLGTCKHGYQHLEKNGILKKILSMLETDDLVSLQLCEPGILKFFGNVINWQPMEITSKYPTVLYRLFNNINSDDYVVLGVTLNTIGHIALSNEGKIALDSTGVSLEQAIRDLSNKLVSLPTDTKIRGLNCIENLLRTTEYTSQISSVTNRWYQLLGESPIDSIWKYAKNPFPEIRLAGLGVINAMSTQIWGQEIIRNSPGLIEFLLDRSMESVKVCKEAKFEIVLALSHSKCFDSSIMKRIQSFVKEGPFYVHTVTEVATEGNE